MSKKLKKKTIKKSAVKSKKKAAKKSVLKKVTTKKSPAKVSKTAPIKALKKKKKTTKSKSAKSPVKHVRKTKNKPSKVKQNGSKRTNPKVARTSGLTVGDIAPAFHMETDTHGSIRLSNYKSKTNVLLYFYPKDDTPGCTLQACSFQKSEHHYNDANVTVIGVSPDSIASHQKFRSKYSLGFTLASDPDHSVSKAYGVWVLKNNYGKKYMGIQRTTFLIGKDGKIKAVWPKVKVEGHDREIQREIAQLD